MNKKNTKKTTKNCKKSKSFTITFSKDDDIRYILFMEQCKDKNQFIKDSIDKAINEERMKETIWDIN